jgi:nucleotide-binding universal stress UspA family protein
MLTSILIGLDGSPFSHAAVELGLRWAKRFDAVLCGIGIVDEPTIVRPEPVMMSVSSAMQADPTGQQFRIDRELLQEKYRKVERFLEHFALQCAEAKVSCKVLEDIGNPGERIEVQATRFDLVLLGRRTFFNHGTAEELDGTLARIVKHAPRPIVTVPNSIRDSKRILVAYDGSPGAARALQAFECTGLGQDCEVHVLSVADSRAMASANVQRAADFLNWHNVQAVTKAVVAKADPAEIIEREAWNLDPSLLVMGAFGHSPMAEFLFGSVTRSMLKRSPVPMFLYH